MFDSSQTPTGSENGEERKKDTKHASDLLEGPDIDDEGIIIVHVHYVCM